MENHDPTDFPKLIFDERAIESDTNRDGNANHCNNVAYTTMLIILVAFGNKHKFFLVDTTITQQSSQNELMKNTE